MELLKLWAKYRIVVFLCLILLVSNLVLTSTDGWPRLFSEIVAFAGLFLIYVLGKLNLADIGLNQKNIVAGFKLGLTVIAMFLTVFLLIYLFDSTAFKDPRYHHSLATALYSSLVILPIKTILFEELAFRGVLLGLLLKLTTRRWAIIMSSLLFGLWHIKTSTDIHQVSFLGHITLPAVAVVLPVVLITSLAGFLFAELRSRSKSLAAPIVVHWFINGAATVLAALSWS